MRLLLVRHGESEWNAAGRLQGQADPPLSNLGRHQAARAAARLVDEPIDAIVASDLARASHTARALADAVGLPVVERQDLREVDLGSWTGAAREEIEAADPEAWRRWRVEGVEGWDGGERYAEAMQRVAGAVTSIAAEWAGRTVVAVSHGGCIRLATCHLLGMPASDLGRIMSIGNASITEFLVESDGGGRIVRLNDMAHLLDTTTADDLEPSATTEFEALG
ncbi:MAG: histidine phosphatase family protein [Actinobacteria bacterium]|nr:histidine phosphatase family protein [Actinomycetota bacterium]